MFCFVLYRLDGLGVPSVKSSSADLNQRTRNPTTVVMVTTTRIISRTVFDELQRNIRVASRNRRQSIKITRGEGGGGVGWKF